MKGRTFKLCVLTRWDFNFCVRSSPLRGKRDRIMGLRQREEGEETETWLWDKERGERDTNMGLGQREGEERQKRGFGTKRGWRETQTWV